MTEKRYTIRRWHDDNAIYENNELFAIVDVRMQAKKIAHRLNEQEEEISNLQLIIGVNGKAYRKSVKEYEEFIEELEQENEQLKQRNNRQYKRLKELGDLILARDWETLERKAIEIEENDKLLEIEDKATDIHMVINDD